MPQPNSLFLPYPVTAWNSTDIQRSDLEPAIRRHIREKEKTLDRRCRKLWYFKNRLDEHFIFGSFCRNYDRLVVTVAGFVHGVGWMPQRGSL